MCGTYVHMCIRTQRVFPERCKAPYHFTATTALMNFLLFVALTLLHTKP